MPQLDTIIDCLGNAIFLSKFGLAKCFHQVTVKLSDRPKTAFVTPWGKYQYRYMPFGLKNALSVFQRLMYVVLRKALYCLRAYIDDIVIYSTSWDDHCQHLVIVLQKLRDAGLTLGSSKCEWLPPVLIWNLWLAMDSDNLRTIRWRLSIPSRSQQPNLTYDLSLG